MLQAKKSPGGLPEAREVVVPLQSSSYIHAMAAIANATAIATIHAEPPMMILAARSSSFRNSLSQCIFSRFTATPGRTPAGPRLNAHTECL